MRSWGPLTFRSLGKEEDLAKDAEKECPLRQEENQKNVVSQRLDKKLLIFQGRVVSNIKCY